ncbi:MAG: hydroxyacid dehydrogenase [Hoeflea sp.]|uniref:hydroxyacid dehydrogenase n=1 Tax=Hoeflea sp. TaxID=1940281 RepID=UPI001DF6EBD7|nr:hydroxyacid dehydrogenase [Hoeflea sp.]MBU4528602.1 hydroxyacid dehydrogenase [Alphaproteobacteria bacterium]MBU4545593.1 hydroxyacid dehydrogenase [Alphaproteobacteria bacterium]MBU4552203.1 hydroxyacid dehydrogenase [Alphaproteobacteria bacterium]MBV1726205.1 hydroxyacid dehydrogenase [Hoeflea sp.]MBV1762368.1 hydroxyacid dehydrogenase [Hoeflea sp.]
MADIVITEFMDEAAVARLAQAHDTLYDPKLVDDPVQLHGHLSSARALIVRNRTQVRETLLGMGPKLRVVGRLGVGLDNIDVAACKARSIKVIPATGANDLSVAEYVITTALMLLRGSYLRSADVAEGAWPRQSMMGRELADKTIGLVGYGSIAREVAWRAHMMGMQILAYDPYLMADHPGWQIARNVSLDAVLELSDVVSLHTPLTDATRHMIDARALSAMKPDAILINAARGGIVDEAALAEALKGGKLGGAALDVFETEPLTAEAGEKFKDLGNLVLTPHIAGVTDESNERVSHLIAEKVLEVLGNKA